MGEGVARVGGLGGGGAGGVSQVGEEGEGVVTLLCLRLDTDRHLLQGPCLLWTRLKVIT